MMVAKKNNIYTTKLMSENNLKIFFIDLKKTYLYKNLPKDHWQVYSRFGIASLFRFFIPLIFKRRKKILYCDCDIIFLCDAAELFLLINDNDWIAGYGNAPKILESGDKIKVLNSGVLLFNCELTEKNNFTQKCINFLKELDQKLTTVNDQDAVSAVTEGKISHFSKVYNFIWSPHTFDFNKYQPNEQSIKQFFNEVEKAKVIHYINYEKPTIDSDGYFSYIFWKFAKNCSFYKELLEEESKYKKAVYLNKNINFDIIQNKICIFLIYYSKQDYNSAILLAKEIIEYKIDILFIWRCLIEIYIKLKFYEDALSTCFLCLDEYPNSYMIYKYIAQIYNLMGKNEDALLYCEKAIGLGEIAGKAICFYYLNLFVDYNPNKAIHKINLFKNMYITQEQEYILLIKAYIKLNDINKTETLIQKSLKIFPTILHFKICFIELMKKQKKFNIIISTVFSILSCIPFWSKGFHYLGESYKEIGKKDLALNAFNMAIVTDKNKSCWSKCGICFIYLEKKDYVSAENIARVLINDHPYWGISWRMLSYVYNAKGEIEQAILSAQKAFELDPTGPDIKSNLTRLLNKQSNLESK